MNIQIQCCGLVLLLVLLYFYKRQKRIMMKTEIAFQRIYYTTLCCVSLDILSVVALTYADRIPVWLLAIACKSYLISLVVVGLTSLLYVCVDLTVYQKFTRRKIGYYFSYGMAILGAALILLLPICYHYDDVLGRVYTYGPSVITTYVFCIFFILSDSYMMLRYRRGINSKRLDAVRLLLEIWILAAAVQFLFNQLLLVSFAAALGVMVIYLKLENPEANLDRRSGLFNHSALVHYMRELKQKRITYSMIVMNFDRTMQGRMQGQNGAGIFMEIIEFLQERKGVVVFKNVEDEVVLLFQNPEEEEEAFREIQERFKRGWGNGQKILLHVKLLELRDSSMVKSADDILYLIKYIQCNHIEYQEKEYLQITESIISAMYQEKAVEDLIFQAIRDDRITVFYQPIYSTKEKNFTSAEALVRIRDKEGNIVPPGVFIDVAEKNGMILRIGEMVFEKVCCFLQTHDITDFGMKYIEVNLSVVQCAYEHLAEDYISIMKRYGTDPKQINLEITESASLSAKKTLLDNMQRLMEFGVRFSLDDFGTGQSNLNYIVDMPVDIVKFDRGMTNAYFENKKAKHVMDAAMHMIQEMELEIVSEGIEEEEQYQIMEGLGITYIQGYYFSKPLPEGEFLQFISRS